MYSTQAILPELGRDFSVAPSQTGLTVSVVIGALAVGRVVLGPAVGPHRAPRVARAGQRRARRAVGRRRARAELRRAAGDARRAGAVHAGAAHGRRALRDRGLQRAHRLAGHGHVRLRARPRRARRPRRGGPATAATSWRVALGAVAALPLAATLVMRRSLPPETPGPPSAGLSIAHAAPAARQPRAGGRLPDRRGPLLLLHGRLLVHRLPPRAPAVLALAGGHRARVRAVGHGRRGAARGPAGRPPRLARGRPRRPAAVRRRADAVARARARPSSSSASRW